jgi:hypothetical protein
MLLLEDVNLCYGNHLKAMLFSLIGFDTQTCTFICELFCNVISAATLCM